MTGTAAPVFFSSVVLALAVTSAAACGENPPSDEEAVRAKLTEFADATRGRRYARLCDRVLAPRLITDIERFGTSCPVAMREALGDVRDPQLTIGRIRVEGGRANAEVRTVAAGQEPSRDIVELVRGEDGWRISSLSRDSPPSPAPCRPRPARRPRVRAAVRRVRRRARRRPNRHRDVRESAAAGNAGPMSAPAAQAPPHRNRAPARFPAPGPRPVATGHGDDVRFGARALLAALALGLVAVPFGVLLLLVRERWAPLLSADTSVARDLHAFALSSDAFVGLMKALSAIGSAAAYLPAFAVLAAVLVRRRLPRLAVFAVVTVLGSSALNALVKIAVDRARPALPDPVASASGLSFPSGHAQAAVVCYAVLLIVLAPMLDRRGRRLAMCGAGLMALAIGFSRIALGVHYVSDVLAGYVLGAAWVAAMTAAFAAWRRDRGPGADPYGSAAAPTAARPVAVPRPGGGLTA